MSFEHQTKSLNLIAPEYGLSLSFRKQKNTNLLTPPPQQNKIPPYNRSPFGIEAQFQGYNFPDILEAHPIPNKNTNFFLNSTFQKIDFKNVAAFSIFHYLLVQFRKCLIFEFIEIRFDFRKNPFSKRWKINPNYE